MVVSKRLKSLAQETERASGPPPERTEYSPYRDQINVVAVSALFVVLCCVYAVFFYRVQFAGNLFRYQPLAYFLVPDELAQQWCGAPAGELAIGDRLPLLALACAVGGTAFLLGRLILSTLPIFRRLDLDHLEYFAFATGIGLSGLSLLTLVVGLFGGLRQPVVFIAAGVIITVVSVWRARRGEHCIVAVGSAPGHEPGGIPRSAWWTPRVWWLAVPFVMVIVGGALLPPIDFDVLEYHLQVPREWVQSGRITFLPHNVYGNMPLGAEAFVALTMALSPGEQGWWWGALSGKLVMALFAPLSAILLVSAGRRCATREAGILAALLYLSTPWIVVVSVNGLNEGVIAFYVLAAAYAAKLWLDHQQTDPVTARGYVWLAGWMAGSAASCKYTSVVFVVIPLLILVVVRSRHDRVRTFCAFVLAVTLACGLWYAKNWAQTGNPVYPLLAGVFESQPRTPEQVAQFQRAHQVPVDVQGRRYSASQAGASSRLLLGGSLWHSPLIVPFTVLILLRRRTLQQAAFWIVGLLVVVTTWWLFTHRVDRFVVAAWPLLAMAAAIGTTWSSSPAWRGTMWTVLALGLAANFVLVASPLVGDNRYFVRLDQLRDDPQLTTVSIAHRYLNEHVPPGRRALVVGDAAVFNLRVPVLYSTCFDTCILEEVARDRSTAQRRARLAELRVSHIYVNWAEIARYRQHGNYGFTDYITPELVHGELEAGQRLIRRVAVPELDPKQGEVFEVVSSADRP
jgi:hypothetical protein